MKSTQGLLGSGSDNKEKKNKVKEIPITQQWTKLAQDLKID